MKNIQIFLREFGKVLINLGNIIFASLVLGSIIKGDYDRLTVLSVSGCVVALLITAGLILLVIGGEEWKQ